MWCVRLCLCVSARNGISLESDLRFCWQSTQELSIDKDLFSRWNCIRYLFMLFDFFRICFFLRYVSFCNVFLFVIDLSFKQWYLCTPFFYFVRFSFRPSLQWCVLSIFMPSAANICCCCYSFCYVRFPHMSDSIPQYFVLKFLFQSVLRELNVCATKLKFLSIGVSFIISLLSFVFL